MEYYYVVAKISARDFGGGRLPVEQSFGLLITAHPVKWASTINETKNPKTTYHAFPTFYEKVSKKVYDEATMICAPLVVHDLMLGIEIARK